MEWTGLNELREKYLAFFESKEHKRLDSFSLVPQNDQSLLLINSGMAPMKKFFTGEVTPPKKRVTTCQKCIRTPDIERVGKTARHGTFFEMLGNFSFGDYFKHEATQWAWEFCTEVLEMPKDKIWISIYQDDDEAFDIWTKEVGIDPSHIVRLGKEDNFWEHGSGPCGPCSELYFDRGEHVGCQKPDCAVGCDCDRFVEFWNLVFTQFSNDGNGNYTPLDHPNIDTGMGLERLACILQGVDNLFEVDTVQNIMKHISKIAGVTYGADANSDVSLRVVTDHIRSTTFMIGDGVLPSNEGRGYVLRRLLRRAARHGRLLGIHGPFLSDVCETVIRENAKAYPELQEKKDFIKKLISVEEESFEKTIDQGLQILNEMADREKGQVFSGETAFKLYDTFGFPIDLTREILAERGMTLDEELFFRLMDEQKQRARSARKKSDGEAWANAQGQLNSLPATNFVGYEQVASHSKVLAIFRDGAPCEALCEGESGLVVLDQSPFYAESGGQVGDTGILRTPTSSFEVLDTTKTDTGVILHDGEIKVGMLAVGDQIDVSIDLRRRHAIMRNHTAAHLLQAALREVLGSHVEQAGQLVNERAVRFDFTHFSAMTAKELAEVEKLVNEQILLATDVKTQVMSMEEAKQQGAMALFGEKYGDVVRVVSAGDFSKELCGGTHMDNTAKLGLFKIVSESSVAAGVRRIEAVTGAGVLYQLDRMTHIVAETADTLKAGGAEDLARKAAAVVNEVKQKEREAESLRSKLAALQVEGLFSEAKEVNDIKIVGAIFNGATPDSLRTMCDLSKANFPNTVLVVAGIVDGKGTISVGCGKNAVQKGAHAGNIVKAVAQIAGGNGGGRPDSAMAGAKEIEKLDTAISQVEAIVGDMLTK